MKETGRKGKKGGRKRGRENSLKLKVQVKYQLREHGIKIQAHSLNQIPLLLFLSPPSESVKKHSPP